MTQKQKILVLEDSPEYAAILLECIRSTYEIQHASDAASAMQIFETKNGIDVVVTDLRLGKNNGIEFIQALRNSGFSGPIIILSGCVDKENLMSAVSLGVFGVLEKPCGLEEILGVLEKAFLFIDHQKIKQEIEIISEEFYWVTKEVMDTHLHLVQASKTESDEKVHFEELLRSLSEDLHRKRSELTTRKKKIEEELLSLQASGPVQPQSLLRSQFNSTSE